MQLVSYSAQAGEPTKLFSRTSANVRSSGLICRVEFCLILRHTRAAFSNFRTVLETATGADSDTNHEVLTPEIVDTRFVEGWLQRSERIHWATSALSDNVECNNTPPPPMLDHTRVVKEQHLDESQKILQ